MITWLASYPRSGNTLLRTLFKQCFGLQTYDAEAGGGQQGVQFFDAPESRAIGHQSLEMPWSDFYPRACSSPEVHYVKLHQTPLDAQKVIYIVRDGRSSVLSYLEYHARFNKGLKTSLQSLIMGLDFYGSWSSHYRAWQQGRGQLLLLRYEEIAQATPEVLQRIADFIERPVLQPWENPFDQLHQMQPGFFRQGASTWRGDERWTPFINSVFFHQHGDLMQELGYALPDEVVRARAVVAPEVLELCNLLTDLNAERNYYRQECDARLKVIEGLDRACQERLRLIETLTGH